MRPLAGQRRKEEMVKCGWAWVEGVVGRPPVELWYTVSVVKGAGVHGCAHPFDIRLCVVFYLGECRGVTVMRSCTGGRLTSFINAGGALLPAIVTFSHI